MGSQGTSLTYRKDITTSHGTFNHFAPDYRTNGGYYEACTSPVIVGEGATFSMDVVVYHHCVATQPNRCMTPVLVATDGPAAQGGKPLQFLPGFDKVGNWTNTKAPFGDPVLTDSIRAQYKTLKANLSAGLHQICFAGIKVTMSDPIDPVNGGKTFLEYYKENGLGLGVAEYVERSGISSRNWGSLGSYIFVDNVAITKVEVP
jgi:hypothetical protein